MPHDHIAHLQLLDETVMTIMISRPVEIVCYIQLGSVNVGPCVAYMVR